VIVTDVPTTPELGDRLVIEGTGRTVNKTPLLACPPTVTTTLPVVAPLGTNTTIDVALQPPANGIAAVPLKVTVLVPCVEPKLAPVMVTLAPTGPDVSERLAMEGAVTVKNLLLETPLAKTVTRILPELTPLGTATTIEVALQLVGVANTPPNVTVPWVEPNAVPVMVTDVPTGPEVGDKLVIAGAGTTVKDTILLFTPLACTSTLPVVAPVGTGIEMELALQLVGVPTTPLKLTVLDP